MAMVEDLGLGFVRWCLVLALLKKERYVMQTRVDNGEC